MLYLWIEVSDEYNFEWWKLKCNATVIVNNIGYLLQAVKFIKPFKWKYGFPIEYYVY